MRDQKKQKDFEIFYEYTESWKTKDVAHFLSLLSEDVNIIECFGANYIGKNECERWFTHWNENEKNQVISWEVLNHYYDREAAVSTFEWLFNYTYKGQDNHFTGITLLKIENDKIVQVKEFESKTETYRPFG